MRFRCGQEASAEPTRMSANIVTREYSGMLQSQEQSLRLGFHIKKSIRFWCEVYMKISINNF